MKKPRGVVYVAETSCCGMKVHDPTWGAKPCHARRCDLDKHLPKTESYPACTIVRYWEYTAHKVYKERS